MAQLENTQSFLGDSQLSTDNLTSIDPPSTISIQNPSAAFPTYISTINFKPPVTTESTSHFYFSFFIADGNIEAGLQPIIPPHFSITIELYAQSTPDISTLQHPLQSQESSSYYALIFRESTYNHKTIPTENGIKAITDAYLLTSKSPQNVAYRLNVYVRWLKPWNFDIPANAEIDAFFSIHSYDQITQDVTYSLGDFTYNSVSYQLNSYEIFNGQKMLYPLPELGVRLHHRKNPLNVPLILKTNSTLMSIPYNPEIDRFSTFDLWIVWTDFFPDDPRLTPNQHTLVTESKKIFNGFATTISLTIIGGVNHFAKIVDDDINYVLNGCYLNQVSIPQDHMTFVNQTINFHLDQSHLQAISGFNENLLHIRCTDTFYILSPVSIAINPPQTSPDSSQSYLNLSKLESFFQVSMLHHQWAEGSKGGELPISNQIQVLGMYTQSFPITYPQINAENDIVVGFPFPMLTPYLSIVTTPPTTLPTTTTFSDASFLNDGPATPTRAPRTTSDEDTYSFSPLYHNYFTEDVSKSPLSPGLASAGAVQWFHIHQQTATSQKYQSLALGGSFQYTFPLRSDLNSNLVDTTGYNAFSNHFLSKPHNKLLPPRFRLYIPYLHTFRRDDLEEVFRDCYITITSLQTGARYAGFIAWNPTIMGYTEWVKLDYETLLFPPHLLESGEISHEFYVNNPPVIQLSFSTYGGEQIGLRDHGLTGIPQQCALEIQHTHLDTIDNTDSDAIKLTRMEDVVNFQDNKISTQTQAHNPSTERLLSALQLNPHNSTSPTPIQSIENLSSSIPNHQIPKSTPPHPFLSYPKRPALFDTSSQQFSSVSTPLVNNTNQSNSNNANIHPLQHDDDPAYPNLTRSTFYIVIPIPYETLLDYTQTGVELIALSSIIPNFRIINHQSEPIQALIFYLHGPFSWFTNDNLPLNEKAALNSVVIHCGDEICIPTELKIKENFILITLPYAVTDGFRILLSDAPYGWLPRLLHPEAVDSPTIMFPYVSLQVVHRIGTTSTGEPILQDFKAIQNQTVSMNFPYADKYVSRSSRGSRPFSWTLDPHTALIVAWVSVSFCFLLFALFVGFAIYYYFGSRSILKDNKKAHPTTPDLNKSQKPSSQDDDYNSRSNSSGKSNKTRVLHVELESLTENQNKNSDQ